MNAHIRRITAALLFTLMLTVVLLSACAIMLEATHDCTGSDCDVCKLLEAFLSVVRLITLTGAFVLMILYTGLARRSLWLFRLFVHRRLTPVTEKVRMLN
ncbi:hypothetical protein [Ruminococcus sp.]|uniref:hypothetical protein n=1 Tax=Ruminococcus sp. TaxID=41978 RepID=UPI003890CB50